jgi:hypothetical protein
MIRMIPHWCITTILLTLTCRISGLSVQRPTSGGVDLKSSAHAYAVLDSLRSSSPEDGPLDLETHFFDASTGLHSEGVWHNALVGISCLRLNQVDEATRIAESLLEHSWDGTSFRRRAWSGRWDHSNLANDSENPPAQANYYRESDEHRCVQHGSALIFWSMLCRHEGIPTKERSALLKQQRKIATSFLEEFWDSSVKMWTTVSRAQGGGTVLRPSASASATTQGAIEPEPYFRAVDQSVAILACLEHLNTISDDPKHATVCTELLAVVGETCTALLSEDAFGFSNLARATTYMGLERNRNFWHEGWVLLALSHVKKHPKWRTSRTVNDETLNEIGNGLTKMYGMDGSIWHWPTASKDSSSNVRYCGDNAMAHAIQRNLQIQADEGEAAFWDFTAELREKGGNLSSVADAYPQVRLHPNTELAAFLVWP